MAETEWQDNEAPTDAQQESYLSPSLGHASEFERLDSQARAVWQLMGGTHTNAPVPNNASLILDVGCGTGVVTISLGLKNPGTEIIGIDLSPVPSIHAAPPNVMYLEGNVFHLAGRDPHLQPETADLVHSRFLSCAMKAVDWPSYIKTLVDLTKPGGYVEVTEFEMSYYRCNDSNDIMGTRYPFSVDWNDALRQALFQRGTNPDAGKHVEGYMRNAGLEDVKLKMFPWARGDWIENSMPETAGVSKINQSEATRVLIGTSLEGQVSKDKIKRYQDDAVQFLENNPDEAFAIMYNVVGQKPRQ